ncbi:MAG: hypothetical protein K6E72_04045 [Saccharofermentans sp.]|nr:hypothetical protein [Saccharofermentans sp.]
MNKSDVAVSIASGAMTALIVDTFIVGDISLSEANDWGREKVEKFVIDVAKHKDKDGKVTDLYSAVKFLEDNFKLPSDPMEGRFGGAKHHHLYDFAHHPTPVGWFCSVMSQFTMHAYGTDKFGAFQVPVEITGKGLESIHKNPIKKVWNGTIDWIFHMISDMAGSSGTIKKGGYGTGLPGPVLSLLKEISSNKHIRKLVGTAGNTDRDNFSVLVQNLFNGRFLADHDAEGKVIKGTKIPFDLRTEIGLGHELTKQTIPVLINECIVRAFFAITRFINELDRINPSTIDDIKEVDFKAFLPFNNAVLSRMLLISSASFTTVDIAASGIKAAVKNPGNKYGFAKDFLLGINYIGVTRFGLAGIGVAVTPERLEKCYDDFSKLTERVKENEIVAVISDIPLGIVPAGIKVVKTCSEAISDYQEATEERIRIQRECDEHIQILTEYRNEIESEVSGYLVANLTVFDEAFVMMDEAVLNNDSDAFIEANSKIQNQLGKDMQFHSQNEFDGFMASDDDFKL